MPKGHVSKRSVDALKCRDKDRVFLWDDNLSGFGVCAFPSGAKVYVAQYRQDGRSRRISIGDHGRLTAEEARSEAKKVLGAVERGLDPIEQRRQARGVRTFREVAEEFMRLHVKAKRKSRTQYEYDRILAIHLFPALGSRRMVDITRKDMARLHAKLADRPVVANRAISLMSSVWNWAARRGEVATADNPAIGIERNPEQKRERFLSTEEFARLGDALRMAETNGLPWSVDETNPKARHLAKKQNRKTVVDAHAVAAIRLLVLTGARVREILHAQWGNVDSERGILHLQDSKTGKKPIYLSAATLDVLNNIPRIDSNPYIIPGQKVGAPRSDLKRPWTAIRKAAKLSIRLHDLRHSYASVGVGGSMGLPIIGKLLGHSQPQTTARYAHLDADPLLRAANTIGATISAAMGDGSGQVIRLKQR
jgi:integrase